MVNNTLEKRKELETLKQELTLLHNVLDSNDKNELIKRIASGYLISSSISFITFFVASFLNIDAIYLLSSHKYLSLVIEYIASSISLGFFISIEDIIRLINMNSEIKNIKTNEIPKLIMKMTELEKDIEQEDSIYLDQKIRTIK